MFTARHGLGSDVITALAKDAAGLWIGTTAGLSRYDGRQAAPAGPGGAVFRTLTRRDGLSHDVVRALHVDADGCVWIGLASAGLNRWHAGQISAFGSAEGLTTNSVLAVYTSREGALWIGTDGGGLNRLREGKLTAFGSRQGLSNRDVYTVAGSRQGALLAGSYLGDVDLLEGTRFRRLVAGQDVGTARVRTLMEDSRGVLWIGTDQGLWRVQEPAPVRVATREGGEGAVRALAEDAAGTLWVGTDGTGLFRVEKDELVPAVPELRSAQVRDIHPDRQGRLWVGTYGGLALLRDGALSKLFTTADGLANAYVRSIHESRDGTLWLGMYGGGLTRYRDGRFVNYGVRQGLLSDVIYAILEDDAGDLWMTCNRGIFRVARQELEDVAAGRSQRVTSQAFDEADGMPTRECNGGNPGAWRTADGRMWFATLGGVVMVDPARMAVNPVPPPVVIDRVVADGVELAGPGQTFQEGEVHALSPRPRRMELHYAGLSFIAPEKVRYRYRLEGFDRDWVEAGSSRTAHYTGLPPRHYRFRVIASNNDGVWNEEGASWEFRLAPALHETPWFLGGVGLLLAAAAFGLHHWRTAQLPPHRAAPAGAHPRRGGAHQGAQRPAAHLRRLQEDPRRPGLLGADRGLHPRPLGGAVQPRALPRLHPPDVPRIRRRRAGRRPRGRDLAAPVVPFPRMDQAEALRLAAEAFDLWQSGHLPEADARYRAALNAADPRHFQTPDIHGQYAGLLRCLFRHAEAGQHLETALKLELQNDADEASAPVLAARYLLGEHYLATGEADSARRVVAPSLAAAPKPLAWLVEAEALCLAGAVTEARVAAERAVSLAASAEQRERIGTRLAELLQGS